MSTFNPDFLVQRCIDQSEPCVPGFGEEPWFSIDFVAEVMGYLNAEDFRRRLNQRNVPRHPIQKKCIRFSDTAKEFPAD